MFANVFFLYFVMIQLTLKDFAKYYAHKPWYGKSVMNVLDGIIINDPLFLLILRRFAWCRQSILDEHSNVFIGRF